jgi:hypothetical protein
VLRANQQLRPEVIRQEIAKVHVGTRDRLTELRAEHARIRDGRVAAAEGRLFQPELSPTASASDRLAARTDYRNALDAAAKVDGLDRFVALAERAARTHDDALARALMVRAVERGWTRAALHALEGAYPQLRVAVDELAAARRHGADARNQLVASAHFSAPVPPELEGPLGSALLRSSAG